MSKEKNENSEESAEAKVISTSIEQLQQKLQVLKKRLDAGERLSVQDLEALNSAIIAGKEMGAAW